MSFIKLFRGKNKEVEQFYETVLLIWMDERRARFSQSLYLWSKNILKLYFNRELIFS